MTVPRSWNALEDTLRREMATFPTRRMRAGYRVDEVERWAAAVVDPALRTGDYWPGPPTTPRFRLQTAGWDRGAVDAFTARYTPFTASRLFGAGDTPFAADLRTLLHAGTAFRPAAQLTNEEAMTLRRQLLLPDAERLVGGLIVGSGQFAEYLYFTDWGLRARNCRAETSMFGMFCRIPSDKAQLLSIPYADFPLASFKVGARLNELAGETSGGTSMWYEVGVFFEDTIFTILSSSSGEHHATQVASWLNHIKDLCTHHLRRTAHPSEPPSGRWEWL